MQQSEHTPEFLSFVEQAGTVNYGKLSNGSEYCVSRLAFHYALYINPECHGFVLDYEERYCYASLGVTLKAIERFNERGEWWWYQKDHGRQLSIEGRFLCRQGDQIVRVLPWDVDAVRRGDLTELPCDDLQGILKCAPQWLRSAVTNLEISN